LDLDDCRSQDMLGILGVDQAKGVGLHKFRCYIMHTCEPVNVP
jgi:hypothetical protein